MAPSHEGSPTKAKEAPSPHEVRLTLLDIIPVFQCLREKLMIRKDTQNVLKEKHKLRSINLYDDDTDTNNKRKIFINQSLCSYYRKRYGMVKDLNKEGLIDSF